MKGNRAHTYPSHEIHYEDGAPSESDRPMFAVVLLHGIMADSASLNNVAEVLQNQFRQDVLIIQPKNREGFTSVRAYTKKQAKLVYQEIEDAIAPYNQAGQRLPIVLIGYSQGGVVACQLAEYYANLAKGDEDKPKILGVVTVHAPLRGVPLLEMTQSNLSQFLSKSKPGLKLVYKGLKNENFYQSIQTTVGQVKIVLRIRIELLAMLRSLPSRISGLCSGGLTDLFPNSSAILKINNFLRKNKKVPCLLIGGYQDNFEEMFNVEISNEDTDTVKGLNEGIAYFMTGKENGRHDMLIPLASQLGRGESFEDLRPKQGADDTGSSSSSKGQPVDDMPANLQGYVYEKTAHVSNCLAIDTFLKIDQDIATPFDDHSIQNDIICTFIRELCDNLII